MKKPTFNPIQDSSFFIQLLSSLLVDAIILCGVGVWYVFEKAGEPGWASLIPIYSIIVMCRISKSPPSYAGLVFIPLVGIVFAVKMLNNLSKCFGKDSSFTVGLVLLGPVFMSILGFGNDTYEGGGKQSAAFKDVLDA